MTEHPSGLVIRRADLSLSRPPRFAWAERIVLDALNLIIGNEGSGKGTLAAWMIARLTRGELPGDLYGQPVAVGVLGDEDGWNSVWTPRLHAAGADLALVKLLERPDGGYVEMQGDRDRLALAVELEQIRVLYFDALIDHLGVRVDDWRTKHVRDALRPLRTIARDFQVAAIGSMHPNKRGGSFRELVSGTSAFNAVSRSSLLLAQHPDDERRRVLVRGKGNLSRTPPAVEFDITGHKFTANTYTFDVPKAANFDEASELTVDDLIAQPTTLPPAGEARTAARELIGAHLVDGDWHDAGPIIEDCAQVHVHERAARRAADDLGVEREPRGFPARVYWCLPRSSHAAPPRDAPVQAVRTVRPADFAEIRRKDSEDRQASDAVCPDRRAPGPLRRAPDAVSTDAELADAELARLTAKGFV